MILLYYIHFLNLIQYLETLEMMLFYCPLLDKLNRLLIEIKLMILLNNSIYILVLFDLNIILNHHLLYY